MSAENRIVHQLTPLHDKVDEETLDPEQMEEYAAAASFLFGCGAAAFTGDATREPLMLVHRAGALRPVSPTVWRQIETDLRNLLVSRRRLLRHAGSLSRPVAMVPNPSWEAFQLLCPVTLNS